MTGIRPSIVCVLLTCCCVVGGGTNPAAAGDERGRQRFDVGTKALSRGGFNDAISHFEQLSDMGIRVPSASFNRGLAYLQRAESTKPRPGDLGQAVAGFRETMLLGGDDAEVASAVERVRHAIARDRSSRGLDPVVVRPSLGRAAMRVVPETVWAALAMLGSLMLVVGLVLRGAAAGSTRGLTAQICIYAGLGSALLFALLTFVSKQLRDGDREAVVVVTEARLLDEGGTALKSRALDVDATAIPEGASVYAHEQRGRLVRVHWGSTEAWVLFEQLRFVAPDPKL